MEYYAQLNSIAIAVQLIDATKSEQTIKAKSGQLNLWIDQLKHRL